MSSIPAQHHIFCVLLHVPITSGPAPSSPKKIVVKTSNLKEDMGIQDLKETGVFFVPQAVKKTLNPFNYREYQRFLSVHSMQ